MIPSTSGICRTQTYIDRYVELYWELRSTDAINRTATLFITYKGGGGGTSNYYISGPFEILLNGKRILYDPNRIQLYNGTLVWVGEVTVPYDDDGSKKITFDVSAAIYYNDLNVFGAGAWYLPPLGIEDKYDLEIHVNNSIYKKYSVSSDDLVRNDTIAIDNLSIPCKIGDVIQLAIKNNGGGNIKLTNASLLIKQNN